MTSSQVSTEINGKTYTGSFSVSGKVLTVSYGGDSKRTQIGGTPPETLAKIMLGELVRKSLR